jgi:hypothetical protein
MSLKTATVTVQGVSCVVEYDYQPKEAQTPDYPGCNENVELTEVKLYSSDKKSSSDFLAILSETFLDALQLKILEECV